MVRFNWFIYLSTVGLLCFEIQPATTQPISEVATAQVSRVKDLPRPATSVQEWLTQDTNATGIVRVTGVQLNPTQSGVEIILEKAGGETLQGSTSIQEDRLIVEVPNAQLQLSEGQFRQDNPVPGIATVEVSAIAANGTVLCYGDRG